MKDGKKEAGEGSTGMKIKYTIIEKFANLTQSEAKLAFHIARLAGEENGVTVGLYYRDAMKECGFCKQSFYNALHGLQEKGVISAEKNSDIDYDVELEGNSFPWKGNAKTTYADGYVSLAREAFRTEEFRKLKPHEKYLLMEFLKHTHENGHSYCMVKDNFIEKWSAALGVCKRTLTGYLKNLKQFFSIGIKDGKYYITYLHSKFKKQDKKAQGNRPEEAAALDQTVRAACNRSRVAYTQESLQQTADLARQYRNLAGSAQEAVSLISGCIAGTAEGVPKEERALDARHIHRMLADLLSSGSGGHTDAASTQNAPVKQKEERRPPSPPKRNAFSNFKQREYDWDDLEGKLLNSTI